MGILKGAFLGQFVKNNFSPFYYNYNNIIFGTINLLLIACTNFSEFSVKTKNR